MRMWNIDSRLLCNQHLLGEHVECHMMLGALKHEKKIDGFLNGLYDLSLLESRHNKLADEMKLRGMNHVSELTIKDITLPEYTGYVDTDKSISDLKIRCFECSKRIRKVESENYMKVLF